MVTMCNEKVRVLRELIRDAVGTPVGTGLVETISMAKDIANELPSSPQVMDIHLQGRGVRIICEAVLHTSMAGTTWFGRRYSVAFEGGHYHHGLDLVNVVLELKRFVKQGKEGA